MRTLTQTTLRRGRFRGDVALEGTASTVGVRTVIMAAAEAVWELPEARADVLGEPEMLGVDYLGPDAATIRVHGRTRPGAQWRVGRLLRAKIAEALTESGIELPRSTFLRPGGA